MRAVGSQLERQARRPAASPSDSARSWAASLGVRCTSGAPVRRTSSSAASSYCRCAAREEWLDAWAEVIAHDYEGLVAKQEASLYEAGPTRRWLKVKQKGWTIEEDRWQRRISAAPTTGRS